MAQSLDKRINGALRSAARLKDVETVISDVEAEIASTTTRFNAETTRSVDPALTTPEARDARNNAADLEHDIRRLNASLGMLQETRDRIINDDREAQRKARYDAAKAKRDALAHHIRTRYPVIAMELVDMVRQIAESDAECRAVSLGLESAEYLARGCGHTWPNDRGLGEVARLSTIKLPLLMRNGSYLPLQVSNITQNAAGQAGDIESDQRDALQPMEGIPAPVEPANDPVDA